MVLQSSGAISLNDIQNEFGGANPIGLNEYYRGGSYVPNITANNSIPTSGAISLSNFYGTREYGFIATLSRSTSDFGENVRSIAVDSSRNIYTVGDDGDIQIAKFNTNGTLQWFRLLGAASADSGNGIAVDSSGNVYIVGRTLSAGMGSSDVYIAKYNTSGTLQWQRYLGSSLSEIGYGIALDSSANIYITGSTSAGTNGSMLTAKYDTNGTIQWQRYIGGSGSEIGYGAAVDSNGNVYVVGSSSSNSNAQDAYLVKYNSSGSLQWQRALGGISNEFGYAIAIDPTSSFLYITGSSNSNTTAGVNDMIIARYLSDGTHSWTRSLGDTQDDYGYGVAVDALGNAYVTGSAYSNNYVLVVKYDSSGTLQWQRRINETPNPGGGRNRGLAIVVAGSSYYIAAYRVASGSSLPDTCIYKFPTSGTLTGTHGAFVYEASTLTATTKSISSFTTSHTDVQSSLSSGTATTLTSSAPTTYTSLVLV